MFITPPCSSGGLKRQWPTSLMQSGPDSAGAVDLASTPAIPPISLPHLEPPSDSINSQAEARSDGASNDARPRAVTVRRDFSPRHNLLIRNDL